MDSFEKEAQELMEQICDRCGIPERAAGLVALERQCSTCPILPAISLALASNYQRGRGDVAQVIMKAVAESVQG